MLFFVIFWFIFGVILIYDGLKNPKWNGAPFSRFLVTTSGFLFLYLSYLAFMFNARG